MKRAVEVTFFALVAATVLLAAQSGFAQSRVTGDPIQGGLIYDNWMLALDQPLPEGDHPLWDRQESNQRSGVVTWRCVECHGWDYQGVDGAYGPYSNHFTGFTGVQDMVGLSEEEVLDWLDGSNNPDHNFLTLTNTTALNDLVAFLRTRQINTDLLIDPATGAALGDHTDGRELYGLACVSCHGAEGDQINFGNALAPLYLGDLAVADPWQTLHKMRFGTPTTERMPSVEEDNWSLKMMGDLLAYLQMLRRGNPDFNIVSVDPNRPVEVEAQGQIDPIVWGALAILLIVAANVAWDVYSRQQSN